MLTTSYSTSVGMDDVKMFAAYEKSKISMSNGAVVK